MKTLSRPVPRSTLLTWVSKKRKGSLAAKVALANAIGDYIDNKNDVPKYLRVKLQYPNRTVRAILVRIGLNSGLFRRTH